MRRLVPVLSTTLLLGALASCDNGDDLTSAADGEAVVRGRVEATVPASASAARSSAQTPAAQGEVSAVVVARLRASGDPQIVAEGTLDGMAYSVAGVPAGLSPLVVIALDVDGDELGRVIVHGKPMADETIVVAPIDAETTLEAMVLASLLENDRDEAASNTGELVAFIHMDAPRAEAILSASAQVELVAEAFHEAQASITATLEQTDMGLDADARAEIATPVARQHATQRDGGGPVELTHDALVEALIGGYADAGVAGADLVVATAAAATAAIQPGDDFPEAATRVAIARQALSINLRARQRLAATTSGGSSTASALAAARIDLGGASTMVQIRSEMDQAATEAMTAITGRVLDLVSELTLSVRTGVEVALDAAIDEANLSARLQGSTSAQSGGSAASEYRTDLDVAVEALSDEIPTEVGFDATATTNLLVAGGGSAWVD